MLFCFGRLSTALPARDRLAVKISMANLHGMKYNIFIERLIYRYYSRGRYPARCYAKQNPSLTAPKCVLTHFVCIAKRVTVRGPGAVNSNDLSAKGWGYSHNTKKFFD